MEKYEIKINKECNQNIIMTKEKLKNRREALNKFRKEVQKQVIINEKRELKSLEYAKHKYVN